MVALCKCLVFENAEPRATADKIIVESMWNSRVIMLGLHVIMQNVALAPCKKEEGPSLFRKAGREHCFGDLTAPLSSVNNWHLRTCHPTGSSTNYFNNQISFSFVFSIFTTESFVHEGHLFYGTGNTDTSSLIH